MAKMGNKFVAMCSVAVGLIYTGAYAVTTAQANPETASAISNANTSNSPSDGSAVSGSTTNSTNTSSYGTSNNSTNTGVTSSNNTSSNGTSGSNSSVSTSAGSSSYKDGTYTGSGRDRRGTVQVAVTIKQGKIADVQITGYVMRYSESYINPILPREVVQRQTDYVDVVSGATSSSENFQYAVEQALAQAK